MGGSSSPLGKIFHTMDKIDPTARIGTKIGIAAPGETFFPAAPTIDSPVVKAMPTMDDAAIEAARKKRIAEQMSRSGRTSTILSDNGDTLGG